jgi:hypothetical protein
VGEKDTEEEITDTEKANGLHANKWDRAGSLFLYFFFLASEYSSVHGWSWVPTTALLSVRSIDATANMTSGEVPHQLHTIGRVLLVDSSLFPLDAALASGFRGLRF